MTDKITADITAVYSKMQKDTAQSLKTYTDKINALEKKTKESWTFTGGKEVLFWCMCIGVLILNLRAALDMFEIFPPDWLQGLAYLGSFAPLIIFFVRELFGKPKNK